MAAREIDTPARNNTRASSFSTGQSFAVPGSDTGAGGANLKKPLPSASNGGSYNKGRAGRASGKEVHHNGGTQAISKGSTAAPR